MPKINFNKNRFKSLKAKLEKLEDESVIKNKSIEYFEEGRKRGEGGFGIRISPKGLKTWFVMYTIRDQVKRFTIGSYADITLKQARAKVTEIMAMVNDGIDPQQNRVDYKSSPTMVDLWEEYQKVLERKKGDAKKAPSNIQEENRKWLVEIKPVLGNHKVQEIKRSHIHRLLTDIADGKGKHTLRSKGSSTVANRTYSLLRVVFKVGLDLGWLETHPMYMMDKPGGSEAPRKRILVEEEIKTLWPVFSEVSANQGDLFKLQLLTAARSGELMKMRWEDIKCDVLTLHDTKAGNDFLVPLSPQVQEILSGRPKVSEWVFPANSKTGHAMCTKSTRLKVQKATGVVEWTNHDLRRTARTLMSQLQIKQHIRERVLNHSQGGVVGVYDQHDYLREKSDALNKLGRKIDSIIGVKSRSQKVVKMKQAGNL